MEIIIMGGFLGSGKTSVILQMAKYLVQKGKSGKNSVVILENEIGEVSIDDKVLRADGFQVENMFSGCICCTMSGELVVNVHNLIHQFQPDWLILEATGVAYPKKVRETLKSSMDIKCRIFCVADAKRWKRLQLPMGNFINDQLDEADIIFLNKKDRVSREKLDEAEQDIRRLNTEAMQYSVSAVEGISNDIWREIFTGNMEGGDLK